MKAKIMRMTNQLLTALELCHDEELVLNVCNAVAWNMPFDEDVIEAAEEVNHD